MKPRPVAVIIIAVVYIVMGAVGFAYHLRDVNVASHSIAGAAAIEVVRLIAIIAGIYMFKAHDWARWTAILWMALHVGIGFLNSWQQAAMHAVFFILIAFFLTRPSVNQYFRPSTPTV